jgi:hypothetical protein
MAVRRSLRSHLTARRRRTALVVAALLAVAMLGLLVLTRWAPTLSPRQLGHAAVSACSPDLVRVLGLTLASASAATGEKRCLPQHLVFSGQVVGTATEALIDKPCTPPSQDIPSAVFHLAIGDRPYTLTFDFRRAPTPSTGVTLAGDAKSWMWFGGMLGGRTDPFAGSVDTDMSSHLPDPATEVHMSGTWRCAVSEPGSSPWSSSPVSTRVDLRIDIKISGAPAPQVAAVMTEPIRTHTLRGVFA